MLIAGTLPSSMVASTRVNQERGRERRGGMGILQGNQCDVFSTRCGRDGSMAKLLPSHFTSRDDGVTVIIR
jgi:hypothetical protein